MPKILPDLLAKGHIQPNRVKLLDSKQGSLKDRVREGLQLWFKIKAFFSFCLYIYVFPRDFTYLLHSFEKACASVAMGRISDVFVH